MTFSPVTATCIVLAFLHDFARDLAADIADFALQVAHARLARVGADHRRDRFVGELDVLVRQPGLHHLLLDQELLGDFDLLRLGVAVQPQHFHAVLQSRRNGVHHVRGGDEKNLREVVFDVEVVIDEHEILLGIEHFEQRGRWIAAEIHRHLVDFVQHEDRILGAGLLHHLDDLAGQRADVGAAMAANFGFVAHAARATCGRTCGRSLWRSTFPAKFCRRPEGRRSRESIPWDF